MTIGDFLRASRARVEPNDVGLVSATGRRVPGLRREEVAALAGVSVDYYARLEQGRERTPSSQMVDALARALRLNPDERGHLYRLAGLGPSLGAVSTRVHPALLDLLSRFPDAAAYVLGPTFDVIAENPIATALLSPFGSERGMPRILFTHPEAATVFPELPLVQCATVHALRLNAGLYPSPVLDELVKTLNTESPSFASLWNDNTVGALTRAYKVFVHPKLGRIELTYQTFDVKDAPGQQLLVGTPSTAHGERGLTILT
jgi:transcriptional regulator with XRE-family HTH domain